METWASCDRCGDLHPTKKQTRESSVWSGCPGGDMGWHPAKPRVHAGGNWGSHQVPAWRRRKAWEWGDLPRNAGPEEQCSEAAESADKTQPELINSLLWCWRCLRGDHTAAQRTLEANWTRLIIRWFKIHLNFFVVFVVFVVVAFGWGSGNLQELLWKGLLSLRVGVTCG